MDVQQFFLKYLLLPIIAVIAATVMIVFNKKNKFIPNKKLIISILLLSLVLAIPGILGLLGLDFMPWGYFISQIYYVFLGCGFVYLMTKYYGVELLSRKIFVFMFLLISVLLGYYIFQTVFDALSTIKIGVWAASSCFNFIIPLLFWWSYVAFLSIPSEIYKIWKYPAVPIEIDMEHLDFNRMLVLELEIYKQINDPEPIKVKVKAPENMTFGHWFYKFIEDYNVKFPKSPVIYKADDIEIYRWIFFIRTSLFKRNLFIDPDLNIRENGITEKMTIHAKRVSEKIARPIVVGDDSIFI
jgi:hypothetical protein